MNRMQQSVESTQAIAESDATAVERTLAGDRDAYRVLVERHSHNVFRLAYRMTRNRPDAEEVVQEAFCARTRSSESLRRERILEPGSIASRPITRLTVCDSARKKKPERLSRRSMKKEWKTTP